MLIIGGAIMLLFGPVALKRLASSARTLQQTKNELTGPGALKRFLDVDDEDDRGDESARDEGARRGRSRDDRER